MFNLLGSKKTRKKDKRAVSPVIATVILVAIAITVAVAVAYWMGGIAGQFTKFEQVEIQSAQCVYDETGEPFWNITIKMKNKGTATATLISVFINELEVDTYGATVAPADTNANTNMNTTQTIASGASQSIWVGIDADWESVTSGTTVNVKIHSAGGMDYIKLVELV